MWRLRPIDSAIGNTGADQQQLSPGFELSAQSRNLLCAVVVNCEAGGEGGSVVRRERVTEHGDEITNRVACSTETERALNRYTVEIKLAKVAFSLFLALTGEKVG